MRNVVCPDRWPALGQDGSDGTITDQLVRPLVGGVSRDREARLWTVGRLVLPRVRGKFGVLLRSPGQLRVGKDISYACPAG